MQQPVVDVISSACFGKCTRCVFVGASFLVAKALSSHRDVYRTLGSGKEKIGSSPFPLPFSYQPVSPAPPRRAFPVGHKNFPESSRA